MAMSINIKMLDYHSEMLPTLVDRLYLSKLSLWLLPLLLNKLKQINICHYLTINKQHKIVRKSIVQIWINWKVELSSVIFFYLEIFMIDWLATKYFSDHLLHKLILKTSKVMLMKFNESWVRLVFKDWL